MMRVSPFRFEIATCLLAVGIASSSALLTAQKPAPKSVEEGKPQTKEQARADEHKLPAERGNVIDRIVAIVNGDLVLESDVEEEERFSKLYPYEEDETKPAREQAITRLIDRTLVLQQLGGFPPVAISDDEVDKEEADLRKDLPACAHADCTSDAGWKKFLEKSGFTEEELHDRLKLRAQVVHFIEQRFRSGIRIGDQQIEDYYNNTLLPQYAKQKATAPPLDSIRDRIKEILLQEQVSALLDAWLKTLRDSGHVRMMQPNEEAP
ncbi:peptidylprolyl isomerase [Terriglobus sp. RCC_193]|uniref:peptidylprolyl isomerase n=1 Tax=Terriglobus sp. RCC_193 TaxID=3239218 RepID=UPI0035252E2D